MRLEEHKNKQPFSTPDGYFEELNRKIIEATCKASEAPAMPDRKRITLGAYTRWISIAAMFALVCLITVKGIFNDASTDNKANTESLQAFETNSEEEEYFDNLLDNYAIDDYTFYCYLTEYE